MPSLSLPERYVVLALRLGKRVDGLIDGYFGPPELAAFADAELPPPEALGEEARAILADLESADLEPQRRRALAAQTEGLACVADLTAGVDVPWRDAVRRCYGIDYEPTPEEDFEAAHERLERGIPGDGELADRLERWKVSQEIPNDRLMPAVDALVAELRARTRELAPLPDGEALETELVQGQPWSAYNWYLGDLRSKIQINTDLPQRAYTFALLVAHEAYPGHHTELSCKEAGLVRARGHVESSVLPIHTPQCVISEGIAMIAVEEALGDDWVARAAELLRPLGIDIDVDTARVVVEAHDDLDSVGTNVACYASERGWSEDEAVEYVRRWALQPEERARKTVGFATHPLWGIYTPTYTYGYRLARRYADRDDGAFRRLLTEPLTTADLLEA